VDQLEQELCPQELGGRNQTVVWRLQGWPRTKEARSIEQRCDKGSVHKAADAEPKDHPTRYLLSHRLGSRPRQTLSERSRHRGARAGYEW
jgi:hypothetical protein